MSTNNIYILLYPPPPPPHLRIGLGEGDPRPSQRVQSGGEGEGVTVYPHQGAEVICQHQQHVGGAEEGLGGIHTPCCWTNKKIYIYALRLQKLFVPTRTHTTFHTTHTTFHTTHTTFFTATQKIFTSEQCNSHGLSTIRMRKNSHIFEFLNTTMNNLQTLLEKQGILNIHTEHIFKTNNQLYNLSA